MDDLTIYSPELDDVLKKMQAVSAAVGMELGLSKCARVSTEGSKTQSGIVYQGGGGLERIKELEEGAMYKYLGIEERLGLLEGTVKLQLSLELRRRLDKIWGSELYRKQKQQMCGL